MSVLIGEIGPPQDASLRRNPFMQVTLTTAEALPAMSDLETVIQTWGQTMVQEMFSLVWQ